MCKILYVLGFAFTDVNRIVLIKKQKPDWMKNQWNGIGGKIETIDGNSPLRAMVREYEEETGITTLPSEWANIASIVGSDYKVNVYTTKSNIHNYVKTIENEEVKTFDLPTVPLLNIVPNLKVLIEHCQLFYDYPNNTCHMTLNYGV